MKFKVGDKVKRIKDYETKSWINYCNKHNKNPMEELTITSIDNSFGDVGFFNEDATWGGNKFNKSSNQDTMMEQIKKAESLLGKQIFKKNSDLLSFIPTRIGIFYNTENTDEMSMEVKEYINAHGYCVALVADGFSYPVEYVMEKPEYVPVKLNNAYAAAVYKDKIVVGCQEFSTSIIAKLLKAFEEVNS